MILIIIIVNTYPFTRAKSTIIFRKLVTFRCTISFCSYTSAQEFQRLKSKSDAILTCVRTTRSLEIKLTEYDSPMIFNVSGKAMSCLICSWKTEIYWSSLKLGNNIRNINIWKDELSNRLMKYSSTNSRRMIQKSVI